MKVKVLSEYGLDEALLGLSLSYDRKYSKKALYKTALKLCKKDGGHNKFLESIMVWIDITAPRYWWSEADTYRIGVTKQSGSTIHTLLRRPLTKNDFEDPQIPRVFIEEVNNCILVKNLKAAKKLLPESFLQRRIVCLNYKTLRNIILQRRNHKLDEWKKFINAVLEQIKNPDLLPGIK